jgi:hypothetical protein
MNDTSSRDGNSLSEQVKNKENEKKEFIDIISFFCEPNKTMAEPLAQLLHKITDSYQDEFPAYMRAIFQWCIDESHDIYIHQLIFFWALCEEEFLIALVRQCSESAPPAYREKRDLFLQYLKLTQQNFVTVFVHRDNCIATVANFCATISDCWTMNRVQYMRNMISQVESFADTTSTFRSSHSSATTTAFAGTEKMLQEGGDAR